MGELMARLRTLKPGFFLNEELGTVPPCGRLLFAGLWCLADRRGRLEDRPTRIKVETLPYDACDVSELLDVLAEKGFVHRYEAAGHHYIQIVNFERHQTPHIKEAESTIPAPDEPDTNTLLAPPVIGNLELGSGNLELGSGGAAIERAPVGSGGAMRASLARKKLTAEEIEQLTTEFAPQLRGADEVLTRIEAALNNTAVDHAKAEYPYVRKWLRDDARKLQEEAANGTNRRTSTAGVRGSGGAPANARRPESYEREPTADLADKLRNAGSAEAIRARAAARGAAGAVDVRAAPDA